MRREGSEEDALTVPVALDFELEEDEDDEDSSREEERDWFEGVLLFDMRFCAMLVPLPLATAVLIRMLGRVRGEYWCWYWVKLCGLITAVIVVRMLVGGRRER